MEKKMEMKKKIKNKIKIFQTIQRQYEILGISSTNQSNQKYSAEKRVFHGFLLFGCLLASQFVYIFHVASGFMEYVNCTCSIFATSIMFVCFAAIVCRKTTFFESIDNIEKFIKTSESTLNGFIYNFLDEKIKTYSTC